MAARRSRFAPPLGATPTWGGRIPTVIFATTAPSPRWSLAGFWSLAGGR